MTRLEHDLRERAAETLCGTCAEECSGREQCIRLAERVEEELNGDRS